MYCGNAHAKGGWGILYTICIHMSTKRGIGMDLVCIDSPITTAQPKSVSFGVEITFPDLPLTRGTSEQQTV